MILESKLTNKKGNVWTSSQIKPSYITGFATCVFTLKFFQTKPIKKQEQTKVCVLTSFKKEPIMLNLDNDKKAKISMNLLGQIRRVPTKSNPKNANGAIVYEIWAKYGGDKDATCGCLKTNRD